MKKPKNRLKRFVFNKTMNLLLKCYNEKYKEVL